MIVDIKKIQSNVSRLTLTKRTGRVRRIRGGIVEGEGLDLSLGDLCQITSQKENQSILAEAVSFRDNIVCLMPLGELRGIGPGAELEALEGVGRLSVGAGLLGRVVNEFGQPIDNKGPLQTDAQWSFHHSLINPLERSKISSPLATGIRAIDGLLACGQGQRVGLFAGSGVGKSVLMGMIARNTSADVNVIALIGERGREIKEFIDENLNGGALSRSVVVAVPSDRPPMARIYAALAATSISEYFSQQGKNVFLMMDSATRIAMALREVGLSTGEPPASKGYPPSVFSFLPKLVERTGNFQKGSITAFYTVLAEGDDLDDPVADTLRSLLDGHIVLSRKLASQNHFPAIDIPESISRCMVNISSPQHLSLATQLRESLAIYRDAEDLINVGAYTKGNQPKIDKAIALIDPINSFLRQEINEKINFSQIVKALELIFESKQKGAS